jgi:2-polyprenyl-3-methyl-5-hydroxy-6-metoxy-1,4-benzoquinol methylase
MQSAERFKKGVTAIGSPEYDRLLKLEMAAWSNVNPQNEDGWAALQKTIGYRTYRSGIIETELAHIEQLGGQVHVLELGSADGWFSNEILRLPNVVDITSIDIALEREVVGAYNKKIHTVQGDLNQMEKIAALKGKRFNCVITRGTLHHLVDPAATLAYVADHLLAPEGILIIEDTWVRQAAQLRTNAAIYSLLYKIPHALRDGWKTVLAECKNFGRILTSTPVAEALVHNHDFSPFESISSADDYHEFYKRKDLTTAYFKNFAALPSWHYTYPGRLTIFGVYVIQPIDTFLIVTGLLVGDLHLCILKKRT